MQKQKLLLRGLFVDPGVASSTSTSSPSTVPLLFLGLTLSRRCNYSCRYCSQEAGEPADIELNGKTLCDLIYQGQAIGVKSVVLAGAGEPLLDPAFSEVVKTAAQCGMTTILYTNGSAITLSTAQFLYEHDVSVCLKLDTLHEERFNWLTGHKRGLELTLRGLDNLRVAGYGITTAGDNDTRITRLAANAVVTRVNLPDLVDLAHFCDRLDIKLFLDNLSVVGRAELNWRELMLAPMEYLALCHRINTSLGYEAVGHSLDRIDACLLWKHGIVIYLDGEARVCYDDPITPHIGNIHTHTLIELVYIKECRYPPQVGTLDCPLKCCFRQRLLERVGTTLTSSEVKHYFDQSIPV